MAKKQPNGASGLCAVKLRCLSCYTANGLRQIAVKYLLGRWAKGSDMNEPLKDNDAGRADGYVGLLFVLFASIMLSVSAGFAAYYFHLLNIIRAAHKEAAVIMALNVTLCLVVAIVIGKITHHIKHRNILPLS